MLVPKVATLLSKVVRAALQAAEQSSSAELATPPEHHRAARLWSQLVLVRVDQVALADSCKCLLALAPWAMRAATLSSPAAQATEATRLVK
jgi:hypothetical protein